ncbi:hypothetical protein ABZ464_01925 [Streptomyces sp. NPDC005820]|uniref:hypothetical protein n=1 Tax=Streptomyces sp. NPDC005820 TaxID=3157069 RepID=UPI00340AD907
MRIRSALAATVLGLALATAGATSAVADEGPHHYGSDHYGNDYGKEHHGKDHYGKDHYGKDKDHYGKEHHGNHGGPVCSPYIGKVGAGPSHIFWAGAHCGWF